MSHFSVFCPPSRPLNTQIRETVPFFIFRNREQTAIKPRSQLEQGEVDYARSREFMRCVHTQTLSGFRSRQLRPGAAAPFDSQIQSNDNIADREDL